MTLVLTGVHAHNNLPASAGKSLNFWLSVDISIYGVNPEGGAAFLGEGRYEGRYSERNEYCDKPITLDGVRYRAVDRNVYDRVRLFVVERHKVRTRDSCRFSSEKAFGELGVLLPRPMNTAAHRVP